MIFSLLRVSLQLTDNVRDPYLLFGLRDDFQRAFRLAVGCPMGECERCEGDPECPYRIVFSQELSSDPSIVKRHQKPPLPFIFTFPVLPSPPNVGITFDVRLTLVGVATRYVREFIDSIMFVLGGRGRLPAVMVRVESLGYHNEPLLLFSRERETLTGDSLTLLTAEGVVDTRMIDVGDEIGLRLHAPLKLVQEGRVMRRFSFPQFMRTLIRRISSLASHYCDDGLQYDFKRLSSLCESAVVSRETFRWEEWGRHGGRLAGLVGEAGVVGTPDELIPFLILGELFNVGKGASFGLGSFTVKLSRL